jgi:hypothetical protein
MANGIISTRQDLLIRLAARLEGVFVDAETCTNEGGGDYETRAVYLQRYKHSWFAAHPDGLRFAVGGDAQLVAKLATLKTAIKARIAANAASQDEIDIDALPAPAALDATWTPPAS